MREVIPISIYNLRMLGREYSVRVLTDEIRGGSSSYLGGESFGRDTAPPSECDLTLAPSPDEDVDISATRAPHLSCLTAALIAARFLLSVRGLPLDELNVSVDGRKIRVASDRERIYVPFRRLSRSSTDIVTALSVELHAETYSTECGVIRVSECERCDFFSDAAMTSIFSDFSTRVAAFVAFSRPGDTVSIKAYAPECEHLADPLLLSAVAYSSAARAHPDLPPRITLALPYAEILIKRASGGAVLSIPKTE